MKNAIVLVWIVSTVFITGIDYAQTGWIPLQINSSSVSGYNLYATETELYAATGSGIYSTGNNGTSWTLKGLTDSGNWVCDVIKSNQYILAATRFGIYRSSNNGTNWSATNLTSTISARGGTLGSHMFAKNSTYLFFIQWAVGVFRSGDDGLNWEQVFVGQYAPGYPDYASTASSLGVIGEKIILGLNSGTANNFYISSDNSRPFIF